MKNLHEFKKNGIKYKAITVDDFKGLYQLFSGKTPVGYEVARIYNRLNKFTHSMAKGITPNSHFGTDGSKSFYTLPTARRYYELLEPLKSQVNEENISC